MMEREYTVSIDGQVIGTATNLKVGNVESDKELSESLDELARFASRLCSNSQRLEADVAEIINEHFWDLV